jgi:hypothetical protein
MIEHPAQAWSALGSSHRSCTFFPQRLCCTLRYPARWANGGSPPEFLTQLQWRPFALLRLLWRNFRLGRNVVFARQDFECALLQCFHVAITFLRQSQNNVRDKHSSFLNGEWIVLPDASSNLLPCRLECRANDLESVRAKRRPFNELACFHRDAPCKRPTSPSVPAQVMAIFVELSCREEYRICRTSAAHTPSPSRALADHPVDPRPSI